MIQEKIVGAIDQVPTKNQSSSNNFYQQSTTLPETKIAPENRPFQTESSIPHSNHPFSSANCEFQGGYGKKVYENQWARNLTISHHPRRFLKDEALESLGRKYMDAYPPGN